MKHKPHGSEKALALGKSARLGNGPSLYELEYLNQVVSELQVFLESQSVTTVKNIYLGFRGEEYSGQMLLGKGV